MNMLDPGPSAQPLPKLARPNPFAGMRARWIGGVAVAMIVIVFGYLDGPWFLGLTLAAGALAWWEYDRMMLAGGYHLPTALGMIWVLTLIGLRAVSPTGDSLLGAVTAGIFVTFVWSLFQNRPTALSEWCFAISGALYLGIFLGYFPVLRSLDPAGLWLALAIGTTAFNDMGAFFVGRRFGQRPLWLRLSPKKTWEGAVGGWLIGILVGALVPLIVPAVVAVLSGTPVAADGLTPLTGALAGALVGIIAPLGDLSMSFVKRNVGVKDAGQLIPGHGGILDRIDSWLFAVPLVYYLALWLVR